MHLIGAVLSLSIRRKFLWSAATRLAGEKRISETSRPINLGQVFILIWNPPKAPMEKCIGRYSISKRVKKSGFSGQVHLSRTIFGRFAGSQPSARWTSLLDIFIFSRRRGKINMLVYKGFDSHNVRSFFFIFISTPEGHERGTFWRIIISFQSGTENID